MPRYNPSLPIVTNGSIARLSLVTMTGGSLSINSFTYLNSTPGPCSAQDLQNLITQWKFKFDADLLTIFSPVTRMFALHCAELHWGSTPSQEFAYAPGVVGTTGVSCLPMEMQATISLYTNVKGQHGRGRIQLPAIPNTFTTPATDPNVLNAAALTAYDVIALDILSTLTFLADIWVPVIATRPVPPATLYQFASPTTHYVIRETLGTQRRRRPGRGI